jgi:flavin-dependent dehydrogenase
MSGSYFGVIVASGGPTGLMPTGDLRLHGMRVLVPEKEVESSASACSLGLYAYSIECW